ncbi:MULTISPECIES: tetratricopeptide repeat protein [unclassified Arcicella]|uniref:tetratricopeptide repeat protein n=1 Tax=unclassified Arcicella TaxID=2644986 RepID=UPI00286631BD|nr:MULTISPECIES: tetratricopeptide repeat protein [unclassified Arcicella]MDR6563943.1 putative negative regulator of RcsB-dependent stress response [Arcicella sp. BE51]MDR6813696.1 putative negative regulator of RcsB-dependent stress response [Arcicella sp. BE140]MDR6824923.1 putative negative regulator of RcsB-dependent stress response [Arcicella sp. BE139]
MTKKDEKTPLDFLETADGLKSELEHDIHKVQATVEKNKGVVYGVAGILVVAILGYFGYKYYLTTQDEAGQAKLFNAVYKFEADSNKVAAKELGKIAEDFGGNTGNLASFYAGVANLKEGKFDAAIDQLKSFSSSDLLVQARAYSLIGDAYTEKKAYSDAITYYKKAAEYKANKFFTPTYLMKLAAAYEANNEQKEALAVYTEIVDKYAESSESINAKKYKAVLEGSVSE